MLLGGLLLLLNPFRKHLQDSSKNPNQEQPKQPISKLDIEAFIRGMMRAAGYSDFFGSIAVAVSKFETANYESNIFKSNHNLFGMRLPRLRKTTATRALNNYAYYENFEDSIKDYIEYLKYFKYPKTFNTVGDYVVFAKEKKYFSATVEQYLKGVEAWIN